MLNILTGFHRYTGTPWFSLFKDNITAAFLDLLQPDAIVRIIEIIQYVCVFSNIFFLIPKVARKS
jgi:hypothetical protein